MNNYEKLYFQFVVHPQPNKILYTIERKNLNIMFTGQVINLAHT